MLPWLLPFYSFDVERKCARWFSKLAKWRLRYLHKIAKPPLQGDASLQHAPTQSGSLPRQGETISEWSQASVTPLLHNGKYWAKSPPTEDERRSYAVHPGRAGPQTG